MPSVLAKWQKCGKSGCRCNEGALHGPYLWLVTYNSTQSTNHRAGKYSWIYLGGSLDRAWQRLISIDPSFENNFEESDLLKKINDIRNKNVSSASPPYTTPLISIPDG